MLGWQSDKEKEGICMKKILMFLSAILLIFAVSCSSDNPQPSESGGTAGNNPNAPEVNTGTSQEELTVIQEVVSKEGMLVDPTYSGKAFYGMSNLVAKGTKKNVLFWNTGGMMNLLSYNNRL